MFQNCKCSNLGRRPCQLGNHPTGTFLKHLNGPKLVTTYVHHFAAGQRNGMGFGAQAVQEKGSPSSTLW